MEVMSMTGSDISASLRNVTGGQAFITVSQLAKALGRTDQAKVKKAYLADLTAVDGKYFLITEVADVMKKRCV
jgi:hypothetical protein